MVSLLPVVQIAPWASDVGFFTHVSLGAHFAVFSVLSNVYVHVQASKVRLAPSGQSHN